MVSRNNSYLHRRQTSERQLQYGVRKLSVGVASVVIGVGFFMGSSAVAHADTTSVSSDKPTDLGQNNEVAASNNVYTSNSASSQADTPVTSSVANDDADVAASSKQTIAATSSTQSANDTIVQSMTRLCNLRLCLVLMLLQTKWLVLHHRRLRCR